MAQVQDGPTRAVRCGIERRRRLVRHSTPLHVPPEMVHRVELRGRHRHEAHVDPERPRELTALTGGMRRTTILA